MATRPITYDMLKAAGACSVQLKLFRKLFGKSVVPTKRLVRKYAEHFSWSWASVNLLRTERARGMDSRGVAFAASKRAEVRSQLFKRRGLATKEEYDKADRDYAIARGLSFLTAWRADK